MLVGGWTNPFEKYARQIGSFPQVGMNIKNTLAWDWYIYLHENTSQASVAKHTWILWVMDWK